MARTGANNRFHPSVRRGEKEHDSVVDERYHPVVQTLLHGTVVEIASAVFGTEVVLHLVFAIATGQSLVCMGPLGSVGAVTSRHTDALSDHVVNYSPDK